MKSIDLSRRRLLLTSAAVLLPAGSLLAKSPAPQNKGETSAQQRLAAIERHIGGHLGVAALDTGSGQHFGHRADERFPMCSTFKFLLVSLVLKRIDAGQEQINRIVPYDQSALLDYAPITRAHVDDGGMSISALCAAALEYSDNTAANLLFASVGGPPALTRHILSLGDSVTRSDRTEPTLNTALPGDPRDTTSPSAMLQDMRQILLGTTLSGASKQQLTDWMMANTTGAADLRAGLPPDWRVGDKTGSGGRGTHNDIAILFPPKRMPLLVAAYSVGSTASLDQRRAALAAAGRIVAASL